jgi:hypothetical protein
VRKSELLRLMRINWISIDAAKMVAVSRRCGTCRKGAPILKTPTRPRLHEGTIQRCGAQTWIVLIVPRFSYEQRGQWGANERHDKVE